MAWTIESYVQDMIARLEEAKTQFEEKTVEACDEIANTAVETLSKNAPYDPEPNNDVIPGEEGHFNESFYAIQAISVGNGIAQTAVETNEPIKFEYVTQGTMDKSPIEPLVKKALWWPALDHPVYSVQGQEPNPFFDESYQQILDEAPTIVEEIMTPVFDLLRFG